MDFLDLTEASVVVAMAQSSLNFFTASLAYLANLAWRLAHTSGKSSPRLRLVGSATWPGANGALGHGGLSGDFFIYFGVTYLYSLHSLAHLLSILCLRTLRSFLVSSVGVQYPAYMSSGISNVAFTSGLFPPFCGLLLSAIFFS